MFCYFDRCKFFLKKQSASFQEVNHTYFAYCEQRNVNVKNVNKCVSDDSEFYEIFALVHFSQILLK